MLLAAVLVLGAIAPTAASAQDGGGLYEPFPEPAPLESVRGYIGDLPGGGSTLAARLTDRELDEGVFVNGPRRSPQPRVPVRKASARAGSGVDERLIDGWPVLLASGFAAAVAGGLYLRSRT